jgi:hypothetical protein
VSFLRVGRKKTIPKSATNNERTIALSRKTRKSCEKYPEISEKFILNATIALRLVYTIKTHFCGASPKLSGRNRQKLLSFAH